MKPKPEQGARATGGAGSPFIPVPLDDAGLTPTQFRVLCHLWRRAGKPGHVAWPGIRSIAKKCRINKDTVVLTIKQLAKLGAITKYERPGATTCYTVNAVWCPLKPDSSEATTPPLKPDTSSGYRGHHPTPKAGHHCPVIGNERFSIEGSPFEGTPPEGGAAVPPTDGTGDQTQKRTETYGRGTPHLEALRQLTSSPVFPVTLLPWAAPRRDAAGCCAMTNSQINELVQRYQHGDEGAFDLLWREWGAPYTGKMQANASGGLTPDELHDVTVTALMQCLRTWRVSRGASFRPYFVMAFNARMMSARKRRYTHRSTVNNGASRLDEPLDVGDEDPCTLADTIADPNALTPDAVLDAIEKIDAGCRTRPVNGTLTERAWHAFKIRGLSYREIAAELNVNKQSVDNALQRARKLRGIVARRLPQPWRRHFSDAELDRALKANGGNIRLAAQSLGTSHATVYARLYRRGVRLQRRKVTTAQVLTAVAEHGTTRAAAAVLGVSVCTVRRHVRHGRNGRQEFLQIVKESGPASQKQ